jgi:DNA-binding XRE family transcriptional regulator
MFVNYNIKLYLCSCSLILYEFTIYICAMNLVEEEKKVLCGKVRSIVHASGLSPSIFADRIHTQRSSISHILSERNKPSLEIVDKILKKFPGITYEWLMDNNPATPLPKEVAFIDEITENELITAESTASPKPSESSKKSVTDTKPVQTNFKRLRDRGSMGFGTANMSQPMNTAGAGQNTSSNITRITICYSDGSYKDLPYDDIMKLMYFKVI